MPRKATKTEEEKAQYIKDKNKRYYQEHKEEILKVKKMGDPCDVDIQPRFREYINRKLNK